jgi:drug/metabolite transporter (DMT)-like permease
VLALSLLGTALPMLLYFVALARIPASTTMLLYRTEPIFVILLSATVLRQHVAPRVWLLTVLAVACSYLIAAGQLAPPPLQSDAAQGALLVLAATALYAVATLLGKGLLDKIPPLTLVWLRFSLALPVLVLLFGAQAAAAIPALKGQDIVWLVWMGSVSSGLTFVFYYKGMQASNAILASVMTLLGPVTGLALSVFLLHESFNAVQVIGIAGLLSTVYFLSTAEIEQAPRKATDPRRAWQDGAADPAGPTPSSEQTHHG